MAEMAQVAVAEDATEAEEIQEVLRRAGIESELQQEEDADALAVLVPADEVEAAQDVLELAEPDDLVADD